MEQEKRSYITHSMNLWQTFEKSNNDSENGGIFFHFDSGIDPVLKNEFTSFARWLRKTYVFPVRLNVYITNRETVLLQNGRRAYGSFRWYPNRPPNIRIPAKPERELTEQYSTDEINEQILSSLVHELTHYFQWALGLEQSEAVSERQANYYRYRIIERFHFDS